MKNTRGFTLIELLAVIIILGILMIIAIPSVTKYISDSRKNAYVDTAKEIIGSARNLVNSGSLEMYDTDATYYIESGCIKTENDSTSPYGKFTKAYVVVTYDGNGYTYYWTSVDDAGQGIKDIIRFEKLDTDNIDSDLNNEDISTLRGIDGRSKTIVVSERNNCQKEGSNSANSQVDSETGVLTKFSALTISENSNLLDYAGAKRYIGSNPDNYVRFNGNELWRIVGVYGSNLKIVRSESIGNKRYNDTANGLNDWESSELAPYLNNNYYNSLTAISKSMIDNHVWNVGAVSLINDGLETYNKSKETTWTGNVGLISLDDFLMAAGDSETCLSKNTIRFENCRNDDWLTPETDIWLLSPYLYNQRDVIFISTSSAGQATVTNDFSIKPAVYLKSSVKITGGTGTRTDPYILE